MFEIGDLYYKADSDHTHYYLVYKVDYFIHVFYIENQDEKFVNQAFGKYLQKDFINRITDFKHTKIKESHIAKMMLRGNK